MGAPLSCRGADTPPRRFPAVVVALRRGRSDGLLGRSSDVAVRRRIRVQPGRRSFPGRPSARLRSDAASQALCSALTNAVGASTPWELGEAQAGVRDLGGMSVPSCEVGAAEGDPQTRLTVAYLPSTEGLAGPDCCRRSARPSSAPPAPPPTAGRARCRRRRRPRPAPTLRRADLTTKDVGVLVLSFNSDEPSYRKTSVDDLAAVGQAMAVDQLLAMAVGSAGLAAGAGPAQTPIGCQTVLVSRNVVIRPMPGSSAPVGLGGGGPGAPA